MSGPFGSSQWMYSSGVDSFYNYKIDQSLRFEDGDNPQLNRTPSSAGNRKTYTISLWVKRSNLGLRGLFAGKQTKDDTTACFFNSNNEFVFVDRPSNNKNIEFRTNAMFRDTSAWYHFVIKVDTTQSTSSNRVKIYVNGEQITSWAVSTYPSQNYNTAYWNNTQVHRIGSFQDNSTLYHDGYIAEFNFVDGTALEPTSFGETKSGIWIPKEYTGSYGTNGFHLDFANASTLGNDVSGNNNDFTSNNLTASEQVIDSPTNNFCNLSKVNEGHSVQISQGHLKVNDRDSDTNASGAATFHVSSGKWYWEVLVDHVDSDYAHVGVSKTDTFDIQSFDSYIGNRADGWGIFMKDGKKRNNASFTTYGSGFADNDVCMICLDMDNGKIWWGKNGTWFASGDPAAGTNAGFANVSGEVAPAYTARDNIIFNFGQDSTFAGTISASSNADENDQGEFKYAPPSGFLALCSANLPAPAIDPAEDETPEDYFNTVLYSGNSSTQSITGVGFQPDFVWVKARNKTYSHRLQDAVRGSTKGLNSDGTSAESTVATGMTSFDSDGFSLGSGTSELNNSAGNYVAWNWLAGNGTSSNTDGSVTTTTSVNAKAGFSILTYTEPSGSSSYGHGLDEKPELIIIKRRNGAEGWIVWHEQFAPPTNKALYLNENYGQGASGSNFMTAVSDSTFTYTSGQYTSAGTKVAYCFHSVDGYSKIGRYEGNGSADGAFVFTNFRPSWVMVKRYDTGGNSWAIFDNKRSDSGFNQIDKELAANESGAEYDRSQANMDFISNGFKMRNTDGWHNASGGDYIFIAFAEQPFKYANAR